MGILIVFLFPLLVEAWYFLADGDPQVGMERDEDGEPLPRGVKLNHINRISDINKTTPIDLILIAGDLTDNGFDGKPKLYKKRREDQLSIYINSYVTPLEEVGFVVYACPGNHDFYTGAPKYKGVSKYLATKYAATHRHSKRKSGLYSFYHKKVLFISMGIYPSFLAWLKRLLKKTNNNQAIVFFWHYNTVVSEPHSDWWSEKEKENFYALIEDLNVQAIINGHFHNSGIGYWHDLPVIRGAGVSYGVIEMNQDTFINVTFVT